MYLYLKYIYFKANKISSSRVYPCIQALKIKLLDNIDSYVYTETLRRNLHKSLMRRFNTLIENDCFKLATFLDPVFGPKAFSSDVRDKVKMRLKYHIGLIQPPKTTEILSSKTVSSHYTFYEEPAFQIENLDDMDLIIDKYVNLVNTTNYEDT